MLPKLFVCYLPNMELLMSYWQYRSASGPPPGQLEVAIIYLSIERNSPCMVFFILHQKK